MYIIIVPILLLTFAVGWALAYSQSRQRANVPGGVLLFYVILECKSRHADSSLSDIAVVTDIIAFLALLSAIIFARRASRDPSNITRTRGQALLVALVIQLCTALIIYLGFSAMVGRLLWL